ncbi:MAG TPA: ABC transporter ATP-binding protein [Gaiellaceae bacterium]|nr:ABC transporter ATP-binding protein [Gaiellaceae bacterium]
MAAEPMIEIQGVGKQFARKKSSANVVLKDVDLTIRRGEFVSLVGQSGCGKTTLLRMIAGLAPYDAGVVKVAGRRVTSVPPRIGFVFQQAALLPWKTVRQNVLLGLNETRKTLTKQEKEERVTHQLQITGLADAADLLPRQLSGGMQQRTGLARALVSDPDVLLMDEPFGAVDALTRIRLQEELAAIVDRTEATVVFVTHDVEEAVYLADRVAVMTIGPGQIKEVVPVDLPRPRDRSPEVIAPIADHVLELVLGGGRRKASPPQPEAVQA